MKNHHALMIAATPPSKLAGWDSSDLTRMQRLLEQENHPSRLRSKLLELALRLWRPADCCFVKISILGKESDWISYEKTTPGKLRNKLAQLIAPVAAPRPDKLLSFIIENVELIRKGGILHLERESDPKVYLNGNAIEDSGIANEWRLFRYQITRLPVDREPQDQTSGPFMIQIADVFLVVIYKKNSLGEEFTFQEKCSGQTSSDTQEKSNPR